MPEMVYAIKGFKHRFSVSQLKRCRHLAWVPMPTDTADMGDRYIAGQPDPCELFTAWWMIVRVASKSYYRGRLQDPSGPLHAEHLAMMTGYPVAIFARALEFFTHQLPWLELVPFEHPQNGAPSDTPSAAPSVIRPQTDRRTESVENQPN